MVAVVCINAKLVDDFKVVFAPVLDIDQGEFQRGTVFAGEFAFFAQCLCGGEYISGDDLIAQAGEFGVG